MRALTSPRLVQVRVSSTWPTEAGLEVCQEAGSGKVKIALPLFSVGAHPWGCNFFDSPRGGQYKTRVRDLRMVPVGCMRAVWMFGRRPRFTEAYGEYPAPGGGNIGPCGPGACKAIAPKEAARKGTDREYLEGKQRLVCMIRLDAHERAKESGVPV